MGVSAALPNPDHHHGRQVKVTTDEGVKLFHCREVDGEWRWVERPLSEWSPVAVHNSRFKKGDRVYVKSVRMVDEKGEEEEVANPDPKRYNGVVEGHRASDLVRGGIGVLIRWASRETAFPEPPVDLTLHAEDTLELVPA